MQKFKFIPIKSHEVPKFLLTSLMLVVTLYVYSVLRGAKDALIISELGAEVMSALKLYGVLPCAVLFMLFYSKLVDHLTRIQIYHYFNWLFVGFFMVFDLYLYPSADSIHYDLSHIYNAHPYLKYILIIFENWSFSLFYIMSELWGSMMIALLFWQLSNQINTIDEAKRFYPLYGFLGQIGLGGSGLSLYIFTDPSIAADWKTSSHYICISILISGVLLSLTLYILDKVIGNNIINGAQIKDKKKKPGLIQSLKYILSSKYLLLITLLILCYGISINLVEAVWKSQVNLLYPETKDIAAFMGKIQLLTCIATFVFAIAGSAILLVFGWLAAALITPLTILLTGVPFFIFIIAMGWISNSMSITPTDIIFYAVIVGAVQNILSKAIKHSLFDSTKEMAYIPLDEELKTKGKAAADVIGGRLGKSGGAIIQQIMLSFVYGSTLLDLATPLFVFFVIIMIVWLYATIGLGKAFKAKTS